MCTALLEKLKTVLATFSDEACLCFDKDYDALKQAFLKLVDAQLLNSIAQHAEDKLFRHQYHVEIAKKSGALFFLQTQNEGAIGLMKRFKCDTFCSTLYQALYSQTLTMGIAFSHLRRQDVMLKGRKTNAGYIIEGHILWATGYTIFDKLFVGFNDEDMNEVFAIVDFKASDHFSVSPAADPIATTAANTVSASFDNLFIPNEHIIFQQKDRFIENITKKSTKQASALFGFALAALDFLPDHSEPLKQSRAFFTAQLEQLKQEILICDDQEASTNCRLKAHTIAQQIVKIASLAIGGRATLTSHPLTRIYRELMLFSISGISPAILNSALNKLLM